MGWSSWLLFVLFFVIHSHQPELGRFAYLKQLSLTNANFSGYVPVELSHLSKLSYLSFSSTNIYARKDFKMVAELKVEAHVFKRMLQNLSKHV